MQKVNMEELQSKYRTKDLAEASFLLAKNRPLLSIEREGRTCWFIFDDKTLCSNLSSEFWFGNAEIRAKVFYDAIQTLKNRIFA